jgi:hypothetical protein
MTAASLSLFGYFAKIIHKGQARSISAPEAFPRLDKSGIIGNIAKYRIILEGFT